MTLPILDFLVERMEEYDPTFEHRVGTAFSELFMQPLSVIVQPLRDEFNEIQTNQSLKRIQELDFPNEHPEDAVDELVGNLYVFRREGAKSSGIVRILYQTAKDLDVIAGGLEFTSTDGQLFLNINSVLITANEMSNQLQDEFFYVDIAVEADTEAQAGDVSIGGIVSVNDTDAVSVTNSAAFSGGADRETNLEIISRTQQSIGVRDLNTGKGFNAIMFENFLNVLTALQPIGFGDPEMMRDIVFNHHIGGRIDGFVKTVAIQVGEFDVFGLVLDDTRRFSTSTNLVLEGTTATSVGFQNLDVSENTVKVFNIDESERSAIYFSLIEMTDTLDLSSNQFLRVGTDVAAAQDISVIGATPITTNITEIINKINIALGVTVAALTINPIIINRRRSGNIPTDNSLRLIDPTPRIFENITAGDVLYILVGDNTDSYIIDSVANDNEINVDAGKPLPFGEVDTNYRISRVGKYIKFFSQTKSADSQVILGSPLVGTDALPLVVGLPSQPDPYIFSGKGSVAYTENVDYTIDLSLGTITRVIGDTILIDTFTGSINNDIIFTDPTINIFLNVQENDILTIFNGVDAELQKDYRIVKKLNNNQLNLDQYFDVNQSGISYRVTRTGIKDAATVLVTFDFNPMSIDIGNLVQLDEYGRELGIRPGRENQTIVDMAFLTIESIELLDPVTEAPLGEILEGRGGFGRGGYGRGGYGRGNRSEYFLVVNKPTLRFSALEDSFIIISTAFLGQSFRVNYTHVPEVVEFHNFAFSDRERVLDAEVLMRHFIPAVVDVTLEYTTDATNVDTPTVEEVETALRNYINSTKGATNLDVSDIIDVVQEQIDIGRTRNITVKLPVTLTATIHNTDATLNIITTQDSLQIPNETIPQFSTAPLSPRTAHWIAGDITLTANETTSTGTI